MQKFNAVIPATRALVDDLVSNEVLSRYGVKAFETKAPQSLLGFNTAGLELNPELAWVSIEVPEDQFEGLSSLQDALCVLTNARQMINNYLSE